MTIRKKLSMGIGVLMTLFLALGVISYFQIGQIDENLTEIIQGRTLGKQAVNLLRRYKTLDADWANELDTQNAAFGKVHESFAEINSIIADKIRAGSDLPQSDEYRKAMEASRMEVHIAELTDSLGTFLLIPKKEHQEHIFGNAGIFEKELRQLKNLPLTEEQNSNVTKLEAQFDKTMSLVGEIIALSNSIQEKAGELSDTRAEIDELLSGDFEVFSRADLERAQEASQRMVGTKVIITLILILTGLLDVSVFSAAITQSITKPLVKLRNAMTEIGRGEFDTIIEVESNDEIGQLACAFKQMTEQRRQAEEKLRQARDELETRVVERTAELVQANDAMESEIRERENAELALEEVNEDLESSIRKLLRSNTELQEFSYIAAHDLKTPLRGISTLADWLKTDYADKFDDEGKEHVGLLIGKTKQMDALVNGVLQYSSLRHNERRKEEVDLNSAVSEAIRGITVPEDIEIIIENELPALICERTHIVQVFHNLLSNAIQHGAQRDGRISVGCVRKDNSWEFNVSDNGPGIDQRYFEKIFRIFQTLSSREETASTGIGLSVVKKIVELNAGSIWVESESGNGSTFLFTLPVQMTAQPSECSAVETTV